MSLLSGLFYVQKYDFDFLETGLIYWNRDCKRIFEFRASWSPAQNDTSTLHGMVHCTNYTFHSMVWPISSWKHGLGWFVIGNSSNIHKTNCQLRFHCYVSTIISKFTDSPIKILSWLFSYVPFSNTNFCHLQILTSELFLYGFEQWQGTDVTKLNIACAARICHWLSILIIWRSNLLIDWIYLDLSINIDGATLFFAILLVNSIHVSFVIAFSTTIFFGWVKRGSLS